MRLYSVRKNQQWRIVFLVLSRLKMYIILFLDIGLDVVRIARVTCLVYDSHWVNM